MRTILINLDRSLDRLEAMARSLAERGLPYERLTATDGKALSERDAGLIAPAASQFRPPSRTEAGAFLSHRRAWQSIAEGGDAWTLVLEDDVVLASDTSQILAAINGYDGEADIVRLETMLRQVLLDTNATPLSPERSMRRMRSWHGGLAAYAISRAAAARLLGLTRQVTDPIDQLLFRPSSTIFPQLHVLQVFPASAVQQDMANRREGQPAASTIEKPAGRWRSLPRLIVKRQVESLRRRRMAQSDDCEYVYVPYRDPGGGHS